MSIKQVGFVCNRALELAQLDSVSFSELARQHYNLVLDDVSRAYDWPYFRVVWADQAMIPGQKAYDLPANYKRSDTCYLFDNNRSIREIFIVSKYQFDASFVPDTARGDPGLAYIDLDARQIVFNNSPSVQTRAFRLTYFRNPVEVDDQGGDDSNDIDFESPTYIMQELAACLMDFRDDDRADAWHAKANATLGKIKMNSYDEDSDSKIELSHAVFKPGRGRGRRGGFGSWGE